jgi:hypothetical protein
MILFLIIFAMIQYVRSTRRLLIKNPAIIAAFIFLISLATKLIFISIIKTVQYSDFLLFYWVTANIAENVPKYLTQNYFSIWAYQVGFPAAMSPILRIFGTSIRPLIITNCVFMAISNSFVYLISRQFVKERISRILSIAYAFFPFVLSLSSVYTNQHLAVMLFYIGLFILTYNRSFSIGRSLAAGIFFALGNMVRPEAITIILSLAAFIVLSFSRESLKTENIKKVLLPVICTVIVYFIGNSLISQFFISSSLNPHGLSNNFPIYKFVVGLNNSTNGTFSQEDSMYLFESQYFIEHPDLRDKEASRIIKERLSVGPKKLMSLFLEKSKIMWTCNSYSYPSFVNYDLNSNTRIFNLKIPSKQLLTIFTGIDFLFFLSIYIFSAKSMLASFMSKENNIIHLLFSIMFLGTFLIYLFIEVQHRYSYFIFPALFVLASSGMDNKSGINRGSQIYLVK